jgi:hypothetical protein
MQDSKLLDEEGGIKKNKGLFKKKVHENTQEDLHIL